MPQQRREGGQLPLLDVAKKPVLLISLFRTSLYSPLRIGTAWGEVVPAEPGRLATADSYWHADVYLHCHPRI